jgi:predicted transcriptional regulator
MPDKEHVARIVGAYVKRNAVAGDELPGLIATVHGALSSVEASEPAVPLQPVKLVPAVPVRRSVQPNSITCLDCGVEKQSLRRHLAAAHGLTQRLTGYAGTSSPIIRWWLHLTLRGVAKLPKRRVLVSD